MRFSTNISSIAATNAAMLRVSAWRGVSGSNSIGGRGAVSLSIIDTDLVTVDAAGAGHFTDIQDALDYVPDGDTVEVLPGTYTGPRNRNLSFHGKDVRLRGLDGPDVTVIDFVPAQDAPRIAAIEASSSSIWMKTPPTFGNLAAILSATSVDGVIG